MEEVKIDRCYIHLTTVPQVEKLSKNDVDFALFKEKYEDYYDLSTTKKVKDAFFEHGIRNPQWSQIHTITLGFVSDEVVRVQVLQGEEKDILLDLLNTLNSDFFKSATLVAWNLSFVLPFITTRMMKHRISVNTLSPALKHLGLKPWSLKQNKSLQDYVIGIGSYRPSLPEFAHNLGFDIKGIVEGSDIYTYYKNGMEIELAESDAQYVFLMVNIDRISEGGKEVDEVVSKIKYVKNVEEVKEPLYARIMKAGRITEEDEAVILDMAKSLTKKEKEHFVLNIKAALGKKEKDLLENDKNLFKKILA